MNEFTGASTKTLQKRLARNLKALRKCLADEEGLGGGSPLEGLYERIDDLEKELERRRLAGGVK